VTIGEDGEAAAFEVEKQEWSKGSKLEARPAAVNPETGGICAWGNNSVSVLDGSTLEERWRLPLGATIEGIRVDRPRHRVLADVETDERRLVWVEGEEVKPLRDWDGWAYDVVALDPERELIYYTTPTIYGAGGYLNCMNCAGAAEGRAQDLPGHLYLMVLGKQPGRSYRAFVPWVSDWSNTWLGVYEGEKEIERIDLERYPKALVYAPGTDQIYLVYGTETKSLRGPAFAIPRGTPPAKADQQQRLPPDTAVPLDVDEAGEFAYYADPSDRVLYKMRLSDGGVVDSRELSFAPTAIAVDDAAGIAHLVDWWAGDLVTVRLF
jgi:hypothetical protein